MKILKNSESMYKKLLGKEDRKLISTFLSAIIVFVVWVLLVFSPILLWMNWGSIKQFFSPKCWEVYKVGADIYSVNKCNGDVKKVSD